ncbi:hypothetical protein L9F63_011504, partial [Diploptera punctata]
DCLKDKYTYYKVDIFDHTKNFLINCVSKISQGFCHTEVIVVWRFSIALQLVAVLLHINRFTSNIFILIEPGVWCWCRRPFVTMTLQMRVFSICLLAVVCAKRVSSPCLSFGISSGLVFLCRRSVVHAVCLIVFCMYGMPRIT